MTKDLLKKVAKMMVKEDAKSLRREDVKFESESGVGGNAAGLSSLPTLPSLIREGGAPILLTNLDDLRHDSLPDKNLTTQRLNVLSSSIKSPRHSEAVKSGDPSLTLRMTGAEESRKNFQFSIFHFQFKLPAFTLAEVLITLGVIGVVAAITMPTLIKNYQKMAWTNQLKESVNIIENGFKKMLADDEVESLEDTEVMKSLDGWYNYTKIDEFSDKLKKYFKIVKYEAGEIQCIYQCKSLDGSAYGEVGDCDDSNITYYLANGSSFYINTYGKLYSNTGVNKYIANIAIDVNAKKGPNQAGRDIFSFVLTGNGNLMPYYGQYNALSWSLDDISTNSYYWKNNTRACGEPGSSTISSGVWGNGCAARIIENGWKMDY